MDRKSAGQPQALRPAHAIGEGDIEVDIRRELFELQEGHRSSIGNEQVVNVLVASVVGIPRIGVFHCGATLFVFAVETEQAPSQKKTLCCTSIRLSLSPIAFAE